MRVRVALAIATWFGCGYAPVAPGTAGSLGALAVAIVLSKWALWHPLLFAALAAALFPVSVWAATVAARESGKKDPGLVVVDEVLGQWITLAGATTAMTPFTWVAAFALFRLFDIWKPWPVRRLEALPEGLGIVADDIGAGVYGALVLFLMGCFNLY
jgi:phosphatidylglycerophosphatase A